MNPKAKINELGNRYGHLVVLNVSSIKLYKSTAVHWICKCDCGKEVIRSGVALRYGQRTHCGCQNGEIYSRLARKHDTPKECHETSYFRTTKVGAKQRHLEFSLTKEEFIDIIYRACFYCGIKAERPFNSAYNTNGKSKRKNKLIEPAWFKESILVNGIDRYDNSLGYTINNSVACCKTCNIAKNSMSIQEFTTWLKRLINFQTTKV